MFKTALLVSLLLLTYVSPASEKEVDELHEHIYALIDSYPDSANSLADYSLSLSEKIDYSWGIGNSFFLKGFIAKKQNQSSVAFLNYLKAIKQFERGASIKEIDAMSKLWSNCGILLANYDKYDDAIDLYNRSLKLAKENNLETRLAWALYNRGNAYSLSGEFDLAIADLKNCYSKAKKLEIKFLVINSINIIGLTQMSHGQYHNARDSFKEIINFDLQSENEIKYVGRAHHNIARTFFEQGDFLQAEKWFRKAVSVKETRNVASELFISYKALSRTLVKNNMLIEAFNIGKKAEKFYTDVKLTQDNIEIFKILREISFKLGEYEEANQYSLKFENESLKYLEEQEKIFNTKEAFTRDLILAGFYQPKNAENEHSFSSLLHGIFLLISLSLFLFYRYRTTRRKLLITEEVRNIQIKSNL